MSRTAPASPLVPAPLSDRASAAAFAEQVHGLLVALTQNLRRETEALRRGAYVDGLGDAETRAELVHAYRQAFETLRANAQSLSRFIPVKLDELRRLHAEFQKELQRNLAALATARSISEQLLGRLAEQAAAASRPRTYGADAMMSRRSGPATLSVDRSL